MDDDFGVGGGLEDRALAPPVRCATARALVRLPLWAMAMPPPVRSANMGWMLRGADAARRGIAVMADGEGAFEVGGVGAVLAEDVADQAGMALGDELAVVIGDDAGGFLAAMLQSVQPQHGQRARIGMAENAENAALLVQRIPLKVLVALVRPVMACRFRRCLSPREACLARWRSRAIALFDCVWQVFGLTAAEAGFWAHPVPADRRSRRHAAHGWGSGPAEPRSSSGSAGASGLGQPGRLRADGNEARKDQIGDADDGQPAHHAEGCSQHAVQRADRRILHAFAKSGSS